MLTYAKSTTTHFIQRAGLISLLLIIQACAGAAEYRPKALIDAESYLQQGTVAYYDDEYPLAADNFSKALKIYLSIDNYQGMIDSYTNLMETSMAIGNFFMAREQMQKIEEMLATNKDKNNRVRVTLLKVKLLFNEHNYALSLAEITPLLPEFDQHQQAQQPDANTLNILSSMALLAVTSGNKDAKLWLERFELALMSREKNANERYQALLLRLKARLKQNAGEYAESKSLLDAALAIYHQHAYRRGIAACLQQQANLELQQQHLELADNFLQRALKIHLWTLNYNDAIQVMTQLIEINNDLGRKQIAQGFGEQLYRIKTGEVNTRQ
jgi:tetratricopeptide (TPR) repeat protein